jgi:TRAP-type mannitol/chloroaromatic compound transport system permease large subunit
MGEGLMFVAFSRHFWPEKVPDRADEGGHAVASSSTGGLVPPTQIFGKKLGRLVMAADGVRVAALLARTLLRLLRLLWRIPLLVWAVLIIRLLVAVTRHLGRWCHLWLARVVGMGLVSHMRPPFLLGSCSMKAISPAAVHTQAQA